MTEYNNLINLMNNVSIKFDENYIIDNDLEINATELTYISNITLNFSQLWALFDEIPLIENFRSELKKYFWIIKGANDIFCIVGYSEKLLLNEDWIILSNTGDPNANQAFLRHMLEAIDCYDRYYRSILENNCDSMEIDSDAYKIKKELKQMIQILKDV